GRMMAVVIEEGFDFEEATSIQKELEGKGVTVKFVSSKLGSIKGSTGKEIEASKNFDTTHSVLFDCVFFPGGDLSSKLLSTNPKAINFLEETFRHNKPIALGTSAIEIFEKSRLPMMISGLKDN